MWMQQEKDGKEASLSRQIQAAQQRVHEALLDNLNSKAALDALLDLVKDTNKYLKERQGNSQGEQQPVQVILGHSYLMLMMTSKINLH